jgi:hypothetical protein
LATETFFLIASNFCFMSLVIEFSIVTHKVRWKVSKNVLHAHYYSFPNLVDDDQNISITIQQSSFIGYWPKPIFGHHT